jgi:hypothetical protein
VFKAALGLTIEDAEFLRNTAQSIAATSDAVRQQPTEYGERYVTDFEMTTDSGTAKVRTAWMIREGEDFPRLTQLLCA